MSHRQYWFNFLWIAYTSVSLWIYSLWFSLLPFRASHQKAMFPVTLATLPKVKFGALILVKARNDTTCDPFCHTLSKIPKADFSWGQSSFKSGKPLNELFFFLPLQALVGVEIKILLCFLNFIFYFFYSWNIIICMHCIKDTRHFYSPCLTLNEIKSLLC